VIRSALAAGSALLALSACQAASEDHAPEAGAAAPSGSASANTAAPPPASDPFAIRPDRDRPDMVAGCPGMNPQLRPRGSNCFGIFPEQCGADQASAFVGRPLSPPARARIEAIAPPDGVRFIRPGEAVIQDLRPGRLNIELDSQGSIERIDCY